MSRDYLTATLYAPMASFGSLAVGAQRDSDRRPARSALLGLIGAALGVARDDAVRQEHLANSYGIAVQTLDPGRAFADYHTAQMPSQARNKRYATRRDELAGNKARLNTVLSSRVYRTDSLHILAIIERDRPIVSLQDVKAALEHPHFTLAAGRKSCPLGLPLGPRIGAHDTTRAALASHRAALATLLHDHDLTGFFTLRMDPGEIAIDLDDAERQGEDIREILPVRDQPISRDRWQFGVRSLAILRAEAG